MLLVLMVMTMTRYPMVDGVKALHVQQRCQYEFRCEQHGTLNERAHGCFTSAYRTYSAANSSTGPTTERCPLRPSLPTPYPST